MTDMHKPLTLALRAAALPAMVFAGVAMADVDVTTHVWERSVNGQLSEQRKDHAASDALVMESWEPSLTASGSSGNDVTEEVDWTMTGDIVVLENQIVMNDDERQASMVLDPNDAPEIPDFFGGAGGGQTGALAQALQQAQQALQQAEQEAPPEAQDFLQGLAQGLGGAQAAGQAAAAGAQISSTGNTGSDNGIDWQELEVQFGGDTTVYRVAAWDGVDDADLFMEHYQTMAEIYAELIDNSGIGQFLQGMQAWPVEFLSYLIDNELFPIYIREGADVQRLVDTGNGTLADDRLGARYEIQSLFPGL